MAIATAITLGAVSTVTNAAVESFDYAEGSLNGLNGGSGWSGAWGSSAYTVTSPGLTYLGIAEAGNKATSGSNSGTLFRGVGETFGTEGTSWYVSFIAQKLVANDVTRFFGVALYSSAGEQLLIGQSSGSPNWNIAKGATASSSTVSSQTEALLVARIDSKAGNDDVTLWVNPDLSLPEGANVPSATLLGITDIDFLTSIRLGGGGANSTQAASVHTIDELRIDSESPFVPEPASLALFGIALPMIALRKR
ncbi:MAG: PEP-CTERM sorting domain-containing protein [Phycisphaerales bacterium]